MTKQKKLIPRKIWLLWYQGLENAPYLIKKCIASWVKHNPTWEIIVLDESNLHNYITLETPQETLTKLSPAHRSDLLRLKLLHEYGGVWADSTTFCNKPLDQWIDTCSQSGFFVFDRPDKDRLMSSWFFASQAGCPITIKLHDLMEQYWIKNDFNEPTEIQIKITTLLSRILNKKTTTTKYWFNPMITKVLGITPYFALHYKFERLIAQDKTSKEIWDNTLKVSADTPHLVQRAGLFSTPTTSIKQKLKEADAPLYKLTWKYDHSNYEANTLLYHILEEC
ncbi:capsular polysaccharide synthesis protein [Psychromonas sp. 14N.309.X.WAT.B.A12]|uniref:capsular polysaccharide synthesis protein n=1 Tax=unclassified Psychromonas TaxID=2614957 RepID=UPI0025AF06D3|nr:capsular polysaccharide synthesis protein [Psychromonas sp. 14N.309.X.WAT.B.A12]MDN2664295.1 glycosyltransferase [Psychromonas sp. 14N.309.X.WAT.B.A12]